MQFPRDNESYGSKTVTLELLAKVNQSLSKAHASIKSSTSELRLAYRQDEHLIDPQTVKYRQQLYSEGVMYGNNVYPKAVEFVRQVKEMLEVYVYVKFDDFCSIIDEMRRDCHQMSAKAKDIQRQHEFVLSNLKRLETEMRQVAKNLQNRRTGLEQRAAAQNRNGGMVSAIGKLAMAAGPVIMPLDGGATLSFGLAVTGTGAAARYAGSQMIDKAETKRQQADAAHCNSIIFLRLLESVEGLCDAVDVVASFIALMGGELDGLSRIGENEPTLRMAHYQLIKGKAGALVENCNAFMAVEPGIRSDLMSIKASLEIGYEKQWNQRLTTYLARTSVNLSSS